jgi:hypothetical protein
MNKNNENKSQATEDDKAPASLKSQNTSMDVSNFGGIKPLTAAQIVTLLLNAEPTMAACVY